ncbi:hypothetical protein BaRGS_00038561, partial [Batillaria attramentaria]
LSTCPDSKNRKIRMGTRKSFKSLILSAWLLANQLVYCILRPTQMDTNLAAVFTGSFYTDNPRPQNHWLMRLTEKQNFRQDGPYQGTFSSKAMDTSDYRNSFGRQMDLHGFSHETNHVPSETLEQQATAMPSTPAKYVTKLPATNVTKNITVSTPSDFFLLVATRNLSTLRTSSSGSSNISIQDDILTKTTAFPDASAEIPREKYGLWHLNLTSCRFHSPSFKSFTRIRSFAHVDTLRAKYVLEANSNSSLRCNVVVYSVRKKYVSALTSVFTLEDRNGVCIGKHIYLSSFDGGGRRISGSLPCSSMFVSTSNTRGLLMIAVDINYYGSAVYSDLFLTLIIRFQLSSTYPEAVLSHVTEGPYTGQLTNFMFDGYILYSAWVSAAAIIRIHSQVLMISFTHFDIACSGYLHISTVKSGSTVTEYPLGLSLHPKVRLTDWSHVWSHCDQWNGGPRLYDRSLVVRFKSGGQAYTGFRMLYSIHNVTQAPQVMHSGLFNCSVPYYPAFRQHLECNLETQCFAREDEDGCPYNSQDCGTGFIDAGNKCLKFYRVRRAITWYDAYDHCSKQNMQLVSPKTQSESGVLLEILNFTVTSFKTPIGLRTSDMSLMPMYREVWQWVDQTMAFHNEMYASERLSKPVCSLLTAPDNYLLTTSCGRSSPFNFLFCERKKHDHRGQRSETRFTTTANFSRLTGSVEMIECPNGHHVKDFLSCDMLSQCGTDSYVTSCQTPELKDVSMFVCDVGAQTLHYTLVCDHRPDCSDGSDETFCVHGQCAVFEFPEVNEGAITAQESENVTLSFTLNKTNCVDDDFEDFNIEISKVGKDGNAGTYCSIRHRNGTCTNADRGSQGGALSSEDRCTSAKSKVITSVRYNTSLGCNATCKPADSSVKPAECRMQGGDCLQIVSEEDMLKLYDLCYSEESNDECGEFHERIVAKLECLDDPIIDPCVEVVKEGTLKVNLLHVWKLNENRIHCTCSITSTLQQGATFNITGLNLYNDAPNNADLKVLGNFRPITLSQLVVPTSPIIRRGKRFSTLFDVRKIRTTSVVRQLLTIRSTDSFLVSCKPTTGNATGKPLGGSTPKSSSATLEQTSASTGSLTTDVTVSTSSTIEHHTTSLPAAPAAGIERDDTADGSGNVYIVVGACCGAAVVVAVVVVAVVCLVRRRRNTTNNAKSSPSPADGVLMSNIRDSKQNGSNPDVIPQESKVTSPHPAAHSADTDYCDVDDLHTDEQHSAAAQPIS